MEEKQGQNETGQTMRQELENKVYGKKQELQKRSKDKPAIRWSDDLKRTAKNELQASSTKLEWPEEEATRRKTCERNLMN